MEKQPLAMTLRPGKIGVLPRSSKPWKALLISDMHLAQVDGDSYFPHDAEVRMFEALPRVVAGEKPDQVFMLGDIFHGTDQLTDEWIDESISRFVSAIGPGIPIFLLGGNHDRRVFDRRGNAWQQAHSASLMVFNGSRAPLLLQVESTTGKHAFLTHDGGNNLWLSADQVVPFLLGLKEANGIDPATLLVAGHTHRVVDLSKAAGTRGSSRVASLGCFTGCAKHSPGLDYGIIQETPDGEFVYRPGHGRQ